MNLPMQEHINRTNALDHAVSFAGKRGEPESNVIKIAEKYLAFLQGDSKKTHK